MKTACLPCRGRVLTDSVMCFMLVVVPQDPACTEAPCPRDLVLVLWVYACHSRSNTVSPRVTCTFARNATAVTTRTDTAIVKTHAHVCILVQRVDSGWLPRSQALSSQTGRGVKTLLACVHICTPEHLNTTHLRKPTA